jgi:hypothetical protein
VSANYDDDKKFANAALEDFMLKVEDAEHYIASLAKPPDNPRPSGSSKRRGGASSQEANAAVANAAAAIAAVTVSNAGSPNISGKGEKRVTINTEAFYEGESAPTGSSKGLFDKQSPPSILTSSSSRMPPTEQTAPPPVTAAVVVTNDNIKHSNGKGNIPKPASPRESDTSDTQIVNSSITKYDRIKEIDKQKHKESVPATAPVAPATNNISVITAEQIELQSLRSLVQNLQLIVQTQAKTIETLQQTIESQQRVIMGFTTQTNNR